MASTLDPKRVPGSARPSRVSELGSIRSRKSLPKPKVQKEVGILDRIKGWFENFIDGAKKSRELYSKEGSYTVADGLPEDVKVIKAANLPLIIVLATPGSPIAALIDRIAVSYSWYYMNIGALLQSEIALEVNKEDEVHHLLHRGIAVPRAFIFEIIRKQMANVCRSNDYKGFILTDYPSTLSQTEEFFAHIYKPDFILFMRLAERVSREALHLYLKLQVKASTVLRRLQPDIHVVSTEQAKKFKREVENISRAFSNEFKIIHGFLSMEDVCREIQKWVERASVLHDIAPPLYVTSPLKVDLNDLMQ